MVNVISFGFKYGMPLDADLVFDVRFLPNPFYVEDLKLLSGLDAPVRDYVFSFEQSNVFMDKLTDMIEYLLPLYIEEGKYDRHRLHRRPAPLRRRGLGACRAP